MFIANGGGFNFEQVALQTRYTFQKAKFPDVWGTNVGQFPFVAHLIRNSLVRYVNYGQKLALMHLRGDEEKGQFQRFFLEARRPRSEVLAVLQDGAARAPACGEEVQFSPIPICDNPPLDLQGYLAKLIDATSDSTLAGLVSQEFGDASAPVARELNVRAP